MSYRKALDKLLAFEPKRLIVNTYEYDGQCCVIGAMLPTSRGQRGSIGDLLFPDEVVPASKYFIDEFQSLEMTLPEADRLQRENDGFRGTPEERYDFMVSTLREWVANES